MSCVELDGVTFRLKGAGRPIVEDISFSLCQGERLTLFGPSGAGKSTILRLIVRLEELTEGAILVDGQPHSSLGVRELRRRVAYLPQEPNLLGLTVRENLDLARELNPKAEKPDFAGLLRCVDLPPELLDRGSRDLSVGQKQRVTIARALVGRPAALLLDEPTSALDPGSESAVAELVQRLAEEHGTAVLSVTHSPRFARLLGGRAVFLVEGRVREEGPMEELLDREEESELARFLDGKLRSLQ